MKLSIVILLAIMPAIVASGATLNQLAIDRIANAIYRAEGGNNTRFPYGIKSIKNCHNRRAICINTIVNNYNRWSGRGDFIVYLADHYCPASTDFIGHKNWINNVKYFLRKD
jgi:hypothetical protein